MMCARSASASVPPAGRAAAVCSATRSEACKYRGRSCASTMSVVAIMAACPITFSSSRTLPGHECCERRICAQWVIPRISIFILRGEAGNEMALEQREVFFALRQPGRFDFHHREAVVQVLPKSLLGDGGPQVVIRSGNDTNVDFAGAQRSHPLHLLTLEHAQQIYKVRYLRYVRYSLTASSIFRAIPAYTHCLGLPMCVRWQPTMFGLTRFSAVPNAVLVEGCLPRSSIRLLKACNRSV
jgi:hypothetical protein